MNGRWDGIIMEGGQWNLHEHYDGLIHTKMSWVDTNVKRYYDGHYDYDNFVNHKLWNHTKEWNTMMQWMDWWWTDERMNGWWMVIALFSGWIELLVWMDEPSVRFIGAVTDEWMKDPKNTVEWFIIIGSIAAGTLLEENEWMNEWTNASLGWFDAMSDAVMRMHEWCHEIGCDVRLICRHACNDVYMLNDEMKGNMMGWQIGIMTR